MTGSQTRRMPTWQKVLLAVAVTVGVLMVAVMVGVPAFSFYQLTKYHDMPPHDLTVKVTGNQWNWTYEYPDHKAPAFTSRMLDEKAAEAKGAPYRLATDEAVVVPVNKVVRVLVTGSDVVHSWGLPAFGIVIDAAPGRVNETWFKAEKTGVYYGQCRQLCGLDHAFMPVEVRVVSQAEFDAWIVAKGGTVKSTVASANNRHKT